MDESDLSSYEFLNLVLALSVCIRGYKGNSMTTQPKQTTRSEEVVRKHKEYLWPAVTNFYKEPLVADHASMQYVWDVEGRKYLDFFGGILTISVGHANPRITGPVKAQIDRLQHLSTLYPNEAIVALAEKVAQITPGALQSSFFTSSGTEANEAAILLARMATGCYDVVALRHAYSGGSSLTKSVTAQAPWRKVRHHQRGHRARDQSILLPLPAGLEISGLRSRLREGRREPDPDGHQRPDCRLHRRTHSGSGRIHHAAAGVFQDCLQGREKIRRPVHFRRSADGLWPHREKMVRHRALGSHAGHHDLRQGHGQRRAHRRDNHHEGTGRIVSGPDDFHLRRQSGHVRRGKSHHRIHRRGKTSRKCGRRWATISAASSTNCSRNIR